uniref:Oviduct-specific glycoprotein n=1 Tax=Suricata suricatta TaxID=37032 RepID=A0A673VT03_SURSU
MEAELHPLPGPLPTNVCSPLPGAARKLVCYFASWAKSRPGLASFLPRDLDPFLCTHLIFAFASMNNNRLVANSLQDKKFIYMEFNRLKERNRELKTLLSIGGWNFGTKRFTTMLSTSANREKFIDSAISLLRTHNFDGLDLFFLYPGLRGSPKNDRRTFLLLIEELWFAFQKEAQLTGRPKLLLSAAVSAKERIIRTAYNASLLGRLLDFINVLSYDFHGSWERFTGHNSPLFSVPGDSFSAAWGMRCWRNLGVPAEKLLMGFPTYGRTFNLLEASKNGLRAKARGAALSGKYTKENGFLAYYEICPFLRNATRHWVDNLRVPYAHKGHTWLGYDDVVSFRHKAMFIKGENLGGAMVWTLDLDDVKGTFCGTGPFPLISKLHSLLMQAEFSSTPSPKFGLSTSMNSMHSQTKSPGEKIMRLGKRAVAPEMMTTPPGNMTVTPDGQTKTLRGKPTTSEANADHLVGYAGLQTDAGSRRPSSGPII